jgi:hypothetical protein
MSHTIFLHTILQYCDKNYIKIFGNFKHNSFYLSTKVSSKQNTIQGMLGF